MKRVLATFAILLIPTVSHAQSADEAIDRALADIPERDRGGVALTAAPARARRLTVGSPGNSARSLLLQFRGGEPTLWAVENHPPVPPALASSSGALWRGALIGAAVGFVAGVVAWQLIQEEDDDSLVNGYAAIAGVAGGALIGLGVAIVF